MVYPAGVRPGPLALLCSAALACATGGAAGGGGTSEAAARATLGRFARALEAGRFDEANRLLSARWRSAYGPGRLALDHSGAGPAAGEAARRVLLRLEAGAPLVRDEGGARLSLPLDGGRAAVLVAEAGGWRVDALE